MNFIRRIRHQVTPHAPSPRITPSLKEWCELYPEASYSVLCPATKVPLEPVHTIEPEILQVFTYKTSKLRAKYLARIPGARITRAKGLILLPDASFVAEVFPSPQEMERDQDVSIPSQRAVFKPGNYFSLVTYWWENYYHWFHDSLQSLYLVLERLPRDTKFIVPNNLAPNLRDALALCGLGEENLMWFSDWDFWELENLFFSPIEGVGGNDSPEADAWFRRRILDALGIASAQSQRRIYITRRSARYCRIVNESELEPILRERGFEIVMAETLTFREQVKLFSEAVLVAGPHGSGLTNMLFAPRGCSVFEMFDRGAPRYAYRTMSSALGHTYWYLQGEPIPNAGEFFPDLHIEPQLFVKTLDAMIEYKAAHDAGGN